MLRSGVIVMVALAAGCGDDGGAVATYKVAASGTLAWGDAPFPNDLYLSASGTVEIGALPSTTPLWESVREHLQTRTGFCGTCAIHFPIRGGAIDPATLADHVVLVDAAGERVEIDVEWDGTSSVISLQAKRGIVLRAGEQYTAGLTNKIRDTSGNALRADTGFEAARARTLTGPAKSLLAGAGVQGTIVATTTFTVEDPVAMPTEIATRVKAYFQANGAPQVTVTQVWKASDGTLTQLLGTPMTNKPGMDNPSQAGSVGEFAVSHATTSIIIKGTYRSVRIIEGSGSDLGRLRSETVAGDAVPFILAIPSGVDVTKLPVIVFAHGLTGQLWQVPVLADMAGNAHAALIGIETFQHGERAVGAVDEFHSARGDDGELGPDGFFEHNNTSITLRYLAVDGVPADQKCSPVYALATLAQTIADYHSAIAMVRSSNLSVLAATDASLAGLAFDSQRIFYAGLSLGTIIGASVLAGDTTTFAAGVFNVPPASITDVLVENDVGRTQAELLVLGPLDIPNETYEPERHLVMNPLVNFYRWVLYPTEPLALARYNASITGRDLLWQIAGLDEAAGTPGGQGLVAAAGVPAVGDFIHASVVKGTAPIAGSGAWLYPVGDHTMIAFQKGVSANEPPSLPPFQKRGTKLMFDNPIEAVQTQMSHFFDTRRASGKAEIR